MPKLVYVADMATAGMVRGGRVVEGILDSITKRAGIAQVSLMQVGSRGLVGMNTFSGGLRGAVADMGRFANVVGFGATTAVRNLSGALSGGLSILTRYAAVGTAVVGILGGLAAKLTVLDSAKFESTVGRAAIQADASPEQRAQLLRHVRALAGGSIFSQQEVADATLAEAQRGRSISEMQKLTEVTTKFAMVANGDLKTAAETLSQVMYQFDIPMEKANETALRLSNAVGVTALNLDDLFQSMQFAGGAAGTFHMDLSELLAILGTLRATMGATVASTGVRNIMLAASAIGTKSPKKLAELGIDEEDIKGTTFMSGPAKSMLDVVQRLKDLFRDRPELLMKAGFGTRTLQVVEQIDKMHDRIEATKARIDDLAAANRRVAETAELADNQYRSLENSVTAITNALGSKLRQALALDSGAGGLAARINEIAEAVASMPNANVQEVLDSLGTGLIQAFGTALAFFVRSLGPIAIGFGDLLFKGIKSAAQSLLDSGEFKSYVAQYSGMTPEARSAEATRLAKSLGVDSIENASPLVLMGAGTNGLRAGAMQRVLEMGSSMDSVLGFALSGIRSASDQAMADLQANKTVQALGRGLSAGRQEVLDKSYSPAEDFEKNAFQIGVMQSGVVNNYGASSPASRAAPARPSGVTRTEAAGR